MNTVRDAQVLQAAPPAQTVHGAGIVLPVELVVSVEEVLREEVFIHPEAHQHPEKHLLKRKVQIHHIIHQVQEVLATVFIPVLQARRKHQFMIMPKTIHLLKITSCTSSETQLISEKVREIIILL